MALLTLAPPSRAPALPRWLGLEGLVIGGAILALIVLVVLPVLSLVAASVWDKGLTGGFFVSALGSTANLRALGNSLILGAWTGLLSIAIGVPLAWAVSRTNVPAKGLIQLTATLSYLSPPFLTAIAFVNLFSPNAGVANVFLREVVGIDLGFNIFTMSGLVFVTVLHTFPFVYLLASSALQSVDASYEEAAQILGASKLRTALTITLPLVAPAVLSGTLLAFVNAIALFGSQAIIGLPGRIVTLPTRIYALFDYPPQYGVASALSLLFIAITVIALYLQRAFLARRSYVTLAGKGARPQLMDLGPWRWVLFAACVVAFFIAILLPYGTLIAVSFSKSWGLGFWQNLTLENYRFILVDYDVTRRAILNSLMLATIAATVCVVLGTVISWIDIRTRLPGRKLLDYAALIPLGLPGIVMAVALLQFWLKMPVALYGTFAILLLAYVGRYVPLGVRAANSSLRQIDPSLEEAAQILGASWGTRMKEITLPLIRPGLFAGWLLVFVPVIQELSASILLFSSESITLAVAVYNLYETGYTEPVAALAIVNMIIIAVAIGIARQFGGSRIGLKTGS
ncbi:ABC transporter permease [Ancylobacter defluvii]|uniref:ABC transporter substrate-binding protein n=1 Tax=Ancylobacter defluvii TaxID=1282440 RepID=A0A9W6K0V6_9HYPH|nr:iron ABC transporter permease [Ancylobacter defluvii]MBS7587140.1 iron ABC transporter permease [Ancylobacter defluvii]GLK85444.1 ABC transporter substrate-binding protein [Ancylobacter defluvii]